MRRVLAAGALGALLWLPGQAVLADWDQGVAAFKAGNYSKAAQEFEAMTQQRPDCGACYLMLGQSLLKLNRSQEAVTQLRKAYDLNPKDASVWLPLAQAYVGAKRYNDAQRFLGTIDAGALPKDKQAGFAQLKLYVAQQTGGADQLLPELRKLAQASPNNASAQFNYGRAAYNAREADEAIRALEAAVRLDGRDPEKRQAVVKAYILKGRQSQGGAKTSAYQNAVNHAQQLVNAAGTYENVMLLGEAQLGAKQYAAAVGTFQRAQKANPNEFLPLFYLGQAQTVAGQYGPAEATLKSALGKASAQEQAMVWKQIAFVYEKQKKLDEAKQAYAKAGDRASIARIEQNQQILDENAQIEEYNKQVEELEAQKKALEQQMKDLPPNF